MRPFDYIAIVAIIVVAVIGRVMDSGEEHGESARVRRPDPRQFEASPPLRNLPPLPAASASDPAFDVEVAEVGSGTGTAFSVDGSGRWITARHVVDGCALVLIGTGPRKGVRVERIVNHPNADLSVLWTRGGTPSLPISTAALSFGQDGFQFGFPKGKPGDVHAELIGRRKMRISGRYRTSEPVIAWTQRQRIPDFGPDVSGISGGPVLNGNGEVIGVVVAGAPRRGRTYSTAPESVFGALDQAGLRAAAASGNRARSLNGRMFAQYGDGLRARLTVAKVFCLRDKRKKSRRPLS